jgi:DMSO/TMAO reductase YedYZ molybdopterin-dependent catalytic subunit
MRRQEKPGLIVRQSMPLNLEVLFSGLTDWIVPTDQFYVRNHFPTPEIDGASWRLNVGGLVETPQSLTLDDLKRLPQKRMTAVVECAGNGRVFYEPPKEGLQWQSGAVGNASWAGVLLRDVLAAAGLDPKAVEVVLVGADRGVVDGGKKTASPGPIAFSRSLPIDKAMSDGVLLAYAMNDEPLSTEHGYPLRAVVGGWFGMAWVKWITEIRVVEKPFLGYWQGRDYFRWDRSLGEPVLTPLTEMEVKAQIARPMHGGTVRIGRPSPIFGAAWSGEAGIARVEVSTDGGASWSVARLVGPDTPFAWRLFEHEWVPQKEGRHALRVRAVDRAGNVQPDHQLQDRESYAANWVASVEVNAVPDMAVAEEFVI